MTSDEPQKLVDAIDYTIPCCADGCDKEATFRGQHSCGAGELFCTAHIAQWKLQATLLSSFDLAFGKLQCRFCGGKLKSRDELKAVAL